MVSVGCLAKAWNARIGSSGHIAMWLNCVRRSFARGVTSRSQQPNRRARSARLTSNRTRVSSASSGGQPAESVNSVPLTHPSGRTHTPALIQWSYWPAYLSVACLC